MQVEQKAISYAHLHAYVDNELTKQRRADVAKYLNSHPSFIICVKDYQDINNNLHKLFDIVLEEPVPEKLLQTVSNENYLRNENKASNNLFIKHKLLVVILGMILGSFIGVALHKSHDLKLLSKAVYIVETFVSRLI